jgi:hypothetical protein
MVQTEWCANAGTASSRSQDSGNRRWPGIVVSGFVGAGKTPPLDDLPAEFAGFRGAGTVTNRPRCPRKGCVDIG